METIPEIRFKVYKSKKEYDKIIRSIKGIPRKVSARKINKIISEKLNLTLLPIINIGKDTAKVFPIWRVRSLKKDEVIDENNVASFKYPPKNKIKMARANRKHQQVFYASSNYKGAFCECEKQIKKNDGIAYLSYWGIINLPDNIHMRNFCMGIRGKDGNSDATEFFKYINDRMEKFINSSDQTFKTNLLYAQKLYTELFLKKGSRYYHITSAIAYSTFVHALESKANMPIIAYPSVAVNYASINFAFRSDFVENHMYLKCVYKVKVHSICSDQIDSTIIAMGTTENGSIKWKQAGFIIIKKDFFNVTIVSSDQKNASKLFPDDYIIELGKNIQMTLEQYMQYQNFNDKYLDQFIEKPEKPLIGKIYHSIVGIELGDNFNLLDKKGNKIQYSYLLLPVDIKYDYLG